MSRLHPTSLVICSLLLIGVMYVASCAVALAQVAAAISGRIEDPSGAAIPAANVTVTSSETGISRTVTADEAGNYLVLSLPVGRYDIKAEKPGFKAAVQTGINLVVGQQAVVNLKVEVGAVQEQVTVTSDAPLVNTTTESVSGLVGEEQVKDLPLNGRSFDRLIALNPGTIYFNPGIRDGGAQGGNLFSVAGRRSGENLTLMNGVEYAGAGNLADTPGGVSGQLLGIDAVREYNVVTDTYGAEYGKRAGAQVSIVTQSGTNQLHGTLFEFLRNSDLDARNFFDQGFVPPFKRNQFGGALGGPIRKNRTFIFGNYEGFRQRLALSGVEIVPDSNARLGLLPCGMSAGVTCAAGSAVGTPTQVPNLDNRMLPFLSLWPAANGPVLGLGLARAFSNPAQQIREDFGTTRVDQTFSNKDTLSAVYTIDDGFSLTPAANPFFGSTVLIRNQILSLLETHIFSPHVINSFTVGVSRANYDSESTILTPAPAGTSFVAGRPVGAITLGSENGGISGVSGVGSANPAVIFRRTLFTYSDGLQIIKGKHQISVGVWFQPIRNNDLDPSRYNGQAVFSNLTGLLQGIVKQFTIAPQATELGWRSWDGAWYVQDSIQVRRNFTVRVGLRHEFSNGWSEATGRGASEVFVNNVLQTQPLVGHQFTTQNNSKWLFGPRLGLAWDVFGNGKTSIRAGAGIYWDLMDNLFYLVDAAQPFNAAAALANVSLFSIVPVNPSTPVPPPCGPGVPTPCSTYSPKGVESNFKVPEVNSWNFTVEQQLARNMALRLTYLGFQGDHQATQEDPNSIQGVICSNPAGCVSGGINGPVGFVPQGKEYIPVGKRPNPFLSNGIFNAGDGNANYNGLQVDLVKRLSHGIQFRGNWTWSKGMDVGTALTTVGGANEGGGVDDLTNLRREWAPGTFDATHQVSGNFIYELPFGRGKAFLGAANGVADKLVSGWQFNTIVSLSTGFAGALGTGDNTSGNGNLSAPDRPSQNPAFAGPKILGLVNEWFDPHAYILPTPGTYGDVARGTIRGPGLANLDVSLFKTTHISERIGLQFRAEFFNVLNHTNLGFPNLIVFSGTSYSPTAGQITRTSTTSRQIQFGMKLTF